MKREWDRIAGGKVAIVLGSFMLKQWWDEFPESKIIIVRVGALVRSRANGMNLQWKPILTSCTSNIHCSDHWDDIRWPGEGYFFNEPRYGHPSMTPLKLMKRLVSIFTQPGDTVLEPFAGVGTTLVAAKELGRKAIGFELNEEYCKIAVGRLSQCALPLESTATRRNTD